MSASHGVVKRKDSHQVPHERRSDERIRNGRKRKPHDDDDLKPLELRELGDHADCNGSAQSAAWEKDGWSSVSHT